MSEIRERVHERELDRLRISRRGREGQAARKHRALSVVQPFVDMFVKSGELPEGAERKLQVLLLELMARPGVSLREARADVGLALTEGLTMAEKDDFASVQTAVEAVNTLLMCAVERIATVAVESVEVSVLVGREEMGEARALIAKALEALPFDDLGDQVAIKYAMTTLLSMPGMEREFLTRLMSIVEEVRTSGLVAEAVQ